MSKTVRPLIAASTVVLLLLAIASAGAAGLPDPLAAKQAAACQQAIAKAGATFAGATLKSLEKCYDGLFKCVQTKPGDQGCLAKATGACAVPAASETCDDWSLATGTRRSGAPEFTSQIYWSNFQTPACNSSFLRLYCVEQ